MIKSINRDPELVYPRVCGGTYARQWPALSIRGLSPRMRGNLGFAVGEANMAGSIPAYAGEPCSGGLTPQPKGVYPRICGGTPRLPRWCWMDRGLSPHMRGNQVPRPDGEPIPGSIPAYAGEPDVEREPPHSLSVYPRICGGTLSSVGVGSRLRGLSPHMRGNLYESSPNFRARGSIPAYAGEPKPPRHLILGDGVYPRICGGTDHIGIAQNSVRGLSPHMRGNHALISHRRHLAGSIPAYAGEP